MLYCSNYSCQAPNSERSKFCQKCRTPLTKRYLWAIGPAAESCRVDELLANRYLVKGGRVLLDTKPGLLPGISTEQIPDELLPYLRLSPYALHVPQVYDWVRLESMGGPERLALLERSPLHVSQPAPDVDAASSEPQLFPPLTAAWARASALRQLNWLWQIAHLWQPFATEQVVSSLLMPDLLRVEGPLVRLMELQLDASGIEPALADLGGLWQQWLPTAHAKISPQLDALCRDMTGGQLHSAEQVIERLDEALWTVAQAVPRQVSLATRTDQGPGRQRNEDACYPPGGTAQAIALTPTTTPLLIVCDGIGGHQGGDVASNLAIAAVQQRLQASDLSRLSPLALMQELEAAACAANDLISQRNDEEQRQDRQRMGTTLVMALVRGHELYLAHVGDSRAYWITPWNCHQITQDDDVASREVRMGYSFYREALQHASSGSLVQALGMSSSALLHANVQRFVLDEDSLFLLCSDGLSDNDRVEQYWDLELLPVLSGRANLKTVPSETAALETVTQRLVDLANSQNGHDNVTVGIIHVRLPSLSPTRLAPTQLPGAEVAPTPTAIASTAVVSPRANTPAAATPADLSLRPSEPALPKTQVVSPVAAKPRTLPLLLTLLALLGAGALGYWLMRDRLANLTGFPPAPTVSPTPAEDPAIAFQPGAFILIGRAADNAGETSGLGLQSALPAADSPAATPNAVTPETEVLAIAPGSVLMVLDRQPVDAPTWLKLKVCSTGQPAESAAASPTATPAASPVPPPIATDNGSASSADPALSAPPAGDLPAPIPTPSSALTPNQSAIATPGKEGWLALTDLRPLVMPNPTLTDAQRGGCAFPPATTPDLPAPPPPAPPAAPPSGPSAPPGASPDSSPDGVG